METQKFYFCRCVCLWFFLKRDVDQLIKGNSGYGNLEREISKFPYTTKQESPKSYFCAFSEKVINQLVKFNTSYGNLEKEISRFPYTIK